MPKSKARIIMLGVINEEWKYYIDNPSSQLYIVSSVIKQWETFHEIEVMNFKTDNSYLSFNLMSDRNMLDFELTKSNKQFNL